MMWGWAEEVPDYPIAELWPVQRTWPRLVIHSQASAAEMIVVFRDCVATRVMEVDSSGR